MDEIKHTKGPWRVLGPDDETDQINVGTDDYFVAGAIGGFTDDEQTQMANAHLIAAAPDMLDALHKIINNWDDLHPKDRAQARAAISKAEGSQP